MAARLHGKLGTFLWAVAACICSTPAAGAADDIPVAAPRLIYFRSQPARELDDKLIHYLKAHLSPTIAVDVSEDPSTLHLSTEAWIAAVRDRVRAEDASAGVWLAPDDKTVMLLAPELSPSPWAVVVAGEKPGSSNWCESMAVLVLSDIAALIPPPVGTSPEPPPETIQTAPVGIGALPPVIEPEKEVGTGLPADLLPVIEPEKEVETELPADPPPEAAIPTRPAVAIHAERLRPRWFRPLWLGGAVGYAPAWQIAGRGPLHSVQLALAMGFGAHLWVSLQGNLAQRDTFVVDDRRVTLRRWPVRTLVHGGFSIHRLGLSAGLGWVWAPTYLRNLPHKPADDDTAEVQHLSGAAGQVSADYWVLPWLGMRCEIGVDVFVDGVRLTYEQETVLQVNRAGATLFLGVTGRFVFRGGAGQ